MDMKANHKATGSVVLMHTAGLHARPCVKLTKLAKRFRAHVRVGAADGGPWTDAKSIVRVMAMKTPCNATLFFEAEGEDAQEAVAALIRLVQSDFEEPTHAA